MKAIWLILPALLLAACATDGGPSLDGPREVIEVGIGESCGGMRMTPQVCAGAPEETYCRYEPAAMCGAADAPGTCQPRPQMCTQYTATAAISATPWPNHKLQMMHGRSHKLQCSLVVVK